MDNQPENNIEEGSLRDLIKILLKRKILVLAFVAVFASVAAVYSLTAQKINSVQEVLEIGHLVDENNREIPLEYPVQVAEKINNDIYGAAAREKLADNLKSKPEVSAQYVADTNMIKILAQSSNSESAMLIINEINKIIIDSHQGKVDNARGLLEGNIKSSQDFIGQIEKRISVIEEGGAAEAENFSNSYLAKDVANIFVVFNAKEQLWQENRTIADLYRERNNTNYQLNSLQNQLKNIRETKIIEGPVSLWDRTSPEPAISLLAGSFLGFIFGIFIAFGIDWWKKSA